MPEQDYTQDAQRIADIWRTDGQRAADAAFRLRCDELGLMLWESSALANEIRKLIDPINEEHRGRHPILG